MLYTTPEVTNGLSDIDVRSAVRTVVRFVECAYTVESGLE